jgi:hypothetical protein
VRGGIEDVFGPGGFNGLVEAVWGVMDGVAVELDAEVGADLDGFDAVALEVGEKVFYGEGGVGFGEFVGVVKEESAGGFVADGVLEAGKRTLEHLGVKVGDVAEGFDVHLEVREGRECGFDGAQVSFALMLALGFS